MLHRQTTGVKTIKSDDPFDFDSRLNSFLKSLDAKGISYDVQTNPTAGLLAFVTWKETICVAESVAEEYSLAGERHTCSECPFYVRPTDGRVKNTRCPKAHRLTSKDMNCCDSFYEMMDKGEIQLVDLDAEIERRR